MRPRVSRYAGTHVSEEYSAPAFRIEHGYSTLLRIRTYQSTQRLASNNRQRSS